MRKLILSAGLLLGLFLASSVVVRAQCDKTVKKDKDCDNKAVAEVMEGDLKKSAFAVQGKCSMCEARIEKAAKTVDGVKKAMWDQESDMLTIKHMADKDNMDDVHKAIAKAGHDTSKEMASDEAYASLPGCCKYREE